MDLSWCRYRVEEFRQLLMELIGQGVQVGQHRLEIQIINDIARREPTIEEICNAIHPEDNRRRYPCDHIDFNPRQEVRIAERFIGRIDDYHEVRSRLTPDSPTAAADRMHPWVWEPARSLWETGHYRDALNSSAKLTNAKIQAKVSRKDVSDDKLIQECFSENPPSKGKPRLRYPGDPRSQTVRSYQQGIRDLALGCIRAIRNPAAHQADQEAEELSEQEALEQLASLSTAARLLEQCEVITGNEEPDDT